MRKVAALLLSICLLSGCSMRNEPLDRAMELRNALLEGKGCTFTAVITADYGDRIYTFQLDCAGDMEGNMTFTVADPETICGITGNISQSGGILTFDDKVLAFPLLADGQLTPVCTPWIFLRTLRSGYISGCSQQDEMLCVYYDDSFENAVLHLEVLIGINDKPFYTEIFWNQSRILSAEIRDFTFL